MIPNTLEASRRPSPLRVRRLGCAGCTSSRHTRRSESGAVQQQRPWGTRSDSTPNVSSRWGWMLAVVTILFGVSTCDSDTESTRGGGGAGGSADGGNSGDGGVDEGCINTCSYCECTCGDETDMVSTYGGGCDDAGSQFPSCGAGAGGGGSAPGGAGGSATPWMCTEVAFDPCCI